MKLNTKMFLCIAIVTCCVASNSMAANVSFDSSTYAGQPGDQIEVTISYDATDLPILGGTVNISYDPAVLEFIAYTPATYPNEGGYPQEIPSSPGSLVAPGEYQNITIGTFEFFLGISTAADFGVFTFEVLGSGGDGGCGSSLCLSPSLDPIYAFVSTDNVLVTGDFFTDGIIAANVVPVPVPAAVWLLLSGLGVLLNNKRRSHR